jgi:uncharacterized delta-60 repeat protein
MDARCCWIGDSSRQTNEPLRPIVVPHRLSVSTGHRESVVRSPPVDARIPERGSRRWNPFLVAAMCLGTTALGLLGCGGSGASTTELEPGPPIEAPTPVPAEPPSATPTPGPTATGSNAVAPGALDPRFGDGGRTIVPFSGTVAVFHRGLRVSADGRTSILAAIGPADGTLSDLARIELLPDGQPALEVGSGGVARPVPELRPWRAAFTPDGGAVVVGEHVDHAEALVVMRLTPAGTVDAGFGRDGIATTHLEVVADALPRDDGSILLVGRSGFEPVLERLTAAGDPDETFGDRGLARFPPVPVSEDGGSYDPRSLAVTDDGRILVSATYFVAIIFRPILFAFKASGELDLAFGAGGIVEDSAILPTGSFDITVDGRIVWIVRDRFVVLRADDGERLAEIPVPQTEYGGGPGGFEIADDGAFVAAGPIFVPDEPRRFDCGNQSGGVCLRLSFLLQILLPDGRGDPDFGESGSVVTDAGEGYGAQDTGPSAHTRAPTGRITVAGAACRAPFVCDLIVLRHGDLGKDNPVR